MDQVVRLICRKTRCRGFTCSWTQELMVPLLMETKFAVLMSSLLMLQSKFSSENCKKTNKQHRKDQMKHLTV